MEAAIFHDEPASKMTAAGANAATIGGVRQALVPTSAHNALPKQASARALEDIYRKMTPLEHILARPDTYIGSVEKQEKTLWVHTGERMAERKIDYAPGLYKIFDEVLVNAADHSSRNPPPDPKDKEAKAAKRHMSELCVVVDEAAGSVSVWNDGPGIPVEKHKTEKVWLPEMIFGQLLTGSNYDDNEKKTTGGRNGYGAKLANIYSTEFVVETCDGRGAGMQYRQVFKNNMSVIGTPAIKPCKESENWTKITFKPDLGRFGMDSFEEDIVSLMRRRVYDMAGVLGKYIKVSWNGEKLPVATFEDYCKLFLGDEQHVYQRFSDRWEICVAPTDDQGFQQVSFANAISTTSGGKHVDYIADQICKFIVAEVTKKHKKMVIKPHMVKNHMRIFVNAKIDNPTFDSQTKDTMTLKVSSFGSKCELPDPLLKKIAACGIMELVTSMAQMKEQRGLKKGDGAKRSRLVGIAKLDDANDAGTKNSQDCTLILTEGDSAKTMAVSGLSVVGRDRYGVFPLRGKLLNVRDASPAQIANNTEIQNIKQIMGLQHGKEYTSTSQLRYGHIMIMTDQDHDGSHIKGLLMNFLHHFFPSLLHIPGFLIGFITPIVKACKVKGTGQARKVLDSKAFYTMPQYEAWKETSPPGTWEIKYYKGLGTSTSEETKGYFADLDFHRKTYEWRGNECGEALQMAFGKKHIEDRKAWLSAFVPGTFLDSGQSKVAYDDFVNKELILFSRADLERSIPSLVDGIKCGQRKVLHICLAQNIVNDLKVFQLAGKVGEKAAYHHGDASLNSTIVGLAQNFVGSNNINLLDPSGQFGSRMQGGKDASSPRYINTKLANLTRHIFNRADDCLLNYLNEEGVDIEPTWYMPILPMVLVNGAEGIGTGWSTSIPNYSPRDIVANLKALLEGRATTPMKPWYKGFKGTIHQIDSKTAGKSYVCSGVVYQVDDRTMVITELPIRRWTQDYKDFLEGLIKPEAASEAPLLLDFKDNSTEADVKMTLQFTSAAKAEGVLQASVHTRLKLQTKLSEGNMMLFDAQGKIKRYETPEQILEEFYDLRLEFYHRRKAALLKTAEEEMRRMSNQVRFIRAVRAGELDLTRKTAVIIAALDADGYDRLPSPKAAKKAAGTQDDDDDDDGSGDLNASGKTFDYLLNMVLRTLTAEKAAKLEAQQQDKAQAVIAIRETDIKQMWQDDLDAFLQALDVEDGLDAAKHTRLGRQQAGVARGKKAAKAARGGSIDSEGDDSDFEDAAKKKKAAAKKAASKKGNEAVDVDVAVAGRLIPPAIAELSADGFVHPKPKRATKKAMAAAATGDDVSMATLDTTTESATLRQLTGNMDNLAVRSEATTVDPDSRTTAATVAAAAKPRAKRPAARKPVVLSDSDDDDSVGDLQLDDESGEGEDSEGSDMDDISSPVAKNPVRPPAGNNGGGKRKPPASKAPASPRAHRGVEGAAAAVLTPVVPPQGKVRRMRPSPFHKASGEPLAPEMAVAQADVKAKKVVSTAPAPARKLGAPKATLAPKPAAAKKAAPRNKYVSDSEDGEIDEDREAAAAAAPVAPRARTMRGAAAAKKNYVIELSDSDGENDSGSDFDASEG